MKFCRQKGVQLSEKTTCTVHNLPDSLQPHLVRNYFDPSLTPSGAFKIEVEDTSKVTMALNGRYEKNLFNIYVGTLIQSITNKYEEEKPIVACRTQL